MTRSRLHSESDTGSAVALREKAEELGQDLRDMASIAMDVGSEQLGKIRDAAAENYRGAKERVINVEESLEAYVRNRPIKSLLCAVGFGMVLAMFWRRR